MNSNKRAALSSSGPAIVSSYVLVAVPPRVALSPLQSCAASLVLDDFRGARRDGSLLDHSWRCRVCARLAGHHERVAKPNAGSLSGSAVACPLALSDFSESTQDDHLVSAEWKCRICQQLPAMHSKAPVAAESKSQSVSESLSPQAPALAGSLSPQSANSPATPPPTEDLSSKRQKVIAPPPVNTLNITVCSQDGNRVYFAATSFTRIGRILTAYCERVGADPERVRLVFDAQRLYPYQTLGDYAVEDGDEIDAMVEHSGSIGVWDSSAASPFVEYLSGSPITLAPRHYLQKFVAQLKADKGRPLSNASLRLSAPRCELISADHRSSLISHINAAYNNRESTELSTKTQTEPAKGPRCDFQLSLSREELESLIGCDAVQRCVRAFGGRLDEVRLRRVEADGSFIAFHLDHPTRVMAVLLNQPNTFKGGRIVYASDDGVLDCPDPPAGYPCLHDGSWVHGVTRLTEGTRYSLFFLEMPPAAAC